MGFYIFHKSGLKLSKNSQLKKFPKDIREQNPISIKGPISFQGKLHKRLEVYILLKLGHEFYQLAPNL